MGLNLMRIEEKIRPAAKIKAAADRIVFSTEARGLISHARAAKAERERIEKEREAVEAQIKAQPHRREFQTLPSDWPPGAETRLHASLGRFCARFRLRNELWLAGEDYESRVREARLAEGLPAGQVNILDGGVSSQTPEQIEARKQLALQRLNAAKGILFNISPKLPGAMLRLTVDSLEPYPREEDMLKHGLYRLAVELGFLKIYAREA